MNRAAEPERNSGNHQDGGDGEPGCAHRDDGDRLQDCATRTRRPCKNIYNKIVRYASRLVPVCQEIEAEYGIDHQQTGGHHARGLISRPDRLTTWLAGRCNAQGGSGFPGTFALVHKGFTKGDRVWKRSRNWSHGTGLLFNQCRLHQGRHQHGAVQAVGMAVVEPPSAQPTGTASAVPSNGVANAQEDNPFIRRLPRRR